MTPTPGHVAYAAYCRTVYGAHAHDRDYHDLDWGQQAAWDAAAQAAITAWWQAHEAVICREEVADPRHLELDEGELARPQTPEETPSG